MKSHTHTDEAGAIVRCYHRARTAVLDYGFWVGLTLGFPVEHFLWEKVPPFSYLTKLLGL